MEGITQALAANLGQPVAPQLRTLPWSCPVLFASYMLGGKQGGQDCGLYHLVL